MPAAAPLIIGAIASSAATAVIASVGGTILGSTILAGLASSAIGGIFSFGASALFSPKAKAQRSGSGSSPLYPYVDNGVKTNTRNTVDFREIVYGQVRKPGSIIFERTTSFGENNRGDSQTGRDVYLHQLIVFAAHRIEEYVDLYLDDDLLTVDADGWVTNAKYTSNTDTAAAKAATSFSDTGTGDTATGSGTSATIYINSTFATSQSNIGKGDLINVQGLSDPAYNGQFEITSIATHNGGSDTRVNYTTDSEIALTGISQSSMTLDVNPIGYRGTKAYVYDQTGHGLNNGDRVYIFDSDVDLFNTDSASVVDEPSTRTFCYNVSETPTEVATSASFQRRNGTDEALVNIKTFLGTAAQNVGTNGDVTALLPGFFQETDIGTELACAYVRFYDASQFSTAPQLTAEIKGARVYDPRDGTLAYSNNAALVLMDYLHRRTGADNDVPFGVGLNYDTALNTSTDIDLDNFSDAASICDEWIEQSDGTYAERYTINGVVSTGDQPVDVIGLMLSAMQGTMTDSDWLIKCFPAVYTPAIHQIDETWMLGEVKLSVPNDKESLINTVRCIFNDSDNLYYPDDMPKYQEAAYLEEDNGEELSEDLQMPFVKEVERAQRLGKLYLRNRRFRKTMTIPLNMRGCVIAPNDTVSITYKRWGWYDRIFKVISVSEGLLNEGVSITIKEESSEIYEWDGV